MKAASLLSESQAAELFAPDVRTADPVQVGGVAAMTTIDFPGRLAAVIFCRGCPWRCRYCHNPHLQLFSRSPGPDFRGEIRWSEALSFLDQRRGFLDGVVFSGGEPTFQKDLPRAIREVRAMGYAVGLHTAGPDPERLQAVLPMVEWVGLDVKAPFDERYDRITGRIGSAAAARESLQRLLNSRVDYQLRTTVHPGLLTPADLSELKQTLAIMGAGAPVTQPFRSEGCADAALCG
jgi:pyruvate formate lyase activating enzyme